MTLYFYFEEQLALIKQMPAKYFPVFSAIIYSTTEAKMPVLNNTYSSLHCYRLNLSHEDFFFPKVRKCFVPQSMLSAL